MLLSILYILIGVVVVLWGADRLTEGAVGVAERLHIPQLVIGLTIVAIGTSMPEFCVSLVSALKGTADLAVGNVVGSNIFNSLLIVGITAMVAPMTILKSTVRLDIPFALLASVMLAAFCYDGELTRLDAGILFGLFLVFMFITLQHAKRGEKKEESEENEDAKEREQAMPVWKMVALILVGLACLVLGSNVFVDGATKVAAALTVVAMGTSMPELATSVVAARKGNSGIAIGNVLGSNVFNILLVIGLTGVINPMHIQGITWIDLSMLILSMVLLLLFSYTKYTIARWEGAVLTILFAGYMTWVVMNV